MTRGSQTGWFGIFALVLVALFAVMGFVAAPQAEAFVPYMVNTVVSPAELGGESPTSAAFANDGKVYISAGNYIKVIDRYAGGISNLAGIYNGPSGLYLDWKTNHLYFADKFSCVIREIDLNQTPPQMNTLAGDGFCGSTGDGGLAVNARLSMPSSITMDAEGNLYIADTGNNKVRIINTSGYIDTYAGTGTAGFGGDFGSASSAILNGPRGVSVSRGYGHLYIADTGNRVIREVDLYDGIINTIAGVPGVQGFVPTAGPAHSISFGMPISVMAIDEDVFVTDNSTHSVGIVEKDWETGQYNYFPIIGNGTAGFYGDGMDSMSALLNSPYGSLFAHPGNVYISDTGNGRIREINVRESEPELIVTFKGAGSGFVNSSPGGDIGYCSTNDSFQRNFVGLDREIGLGVQYSYHDSQELLVFLRQGGSYASTDMDGQWNTRSIQIPAQGQTTGYNITYGVANIASGFVNSGSYDSYGSFNSDSRAVFINTTTGQITVGGLLPGEKYDGALSASKDRMVSAYIGNYTVFLEAMVRKDTGFVSSDMAGRWVMASIRVKMDGYADNFEVGTGELNIEPDGDYWGNWVGPSAYDIFNGIATIDSDGNMSFGSEPGVEDHFVMGADRRTIIGSSSNTTEHFLEFYVMTRMAEDYAYITNDLKGDWQMRNIITRVEGATFGGDVSRCALSYGDAGLLNGTCINPDGSIDGPFSFQSKVEMEGRWHLDIMENNWACESDPEWGTQVTLYANPDGGSTFDGWQTQNGECSGTGPCTFNIYNGTVITAMFSGGGGLNITTSSLPDGALGSPYSQTLYASGGNTPYSWSIVNGTLPAGLALNNSTGQISGTPASAGYYAFTAQVQDFNFATAQRGLSINITTGGYIINSSSSLNGSISPTGSVNVSPGGSQTYTMSAYTGYEVDYVMVDGVNIGAVTSYTFNNVNANHSIAVFFKSSTAIALPATGTLSSAQYGYNYGTSAHPTTLDVTFQYTGDGLERILNVKGYDIDTLGEVTVWFNGMQWASLNNTPNNATGRDNLIWLPMDEMMMGTNTIRFTQNNSNETWGVTRLGVYNAGSTLGYVLGTTGGDTQHASGFDVWLPDITMLTYPAWVLELAGWDSDSNTEIVVDLNGKKLGTLPSGPDNGLSPQYELYMPYDILNPGENYLTFRHSLGGAYNWGVKLNNLTDSGWLFGYMGTNSSTVDAARFLVPIEPSITRPMDVQFYDVSNATEVQVLINGVSAGYAPTTAPSTWGSNQTYNIAPLSSSEWSLVRVEFDNTENPPSTSTWAVRPIEPLDTDNDGRADFSDWAPNDPAEWRDDDNDGIGDNADLDDDNDGMPDTWETSNSFNPDNPADAASDADSDGLTNLGEYALGSNPYNSDTDSDTILDGADSGPNNASDTGPVINIPKGSYDASGYGWGFGTNQHQRTLVGKFTKESYDKLLHIQSWDVDSSNEIEVRLNGVHMGYLSGQNNANGIGTVIVIPVSMQVAGTNYIEIKTVLYDGTWGVQRLGLFNYGMTFGNIQGGTGDRTHQDGIELLYKEQGSSNLIELSGWDSDTNTEIALTLNGSPIGALPIGPDIGWTQWYQLYLPKELGAGDVGRLRVNNSLSSAYNWGVKINSVKPGANQRTAALGYTGGTPGTTVDEVSFLIPVPAEIADYTRWLEVEYYDLDTNGELVFYLNGVAINYMLNPNSNNWGSSGVSTAIPPGGLSVLRIDNINNPAANDLWAVRIVDAPDQDGDGHVDYLDAFPYYDVEWSNMDGDSLGDNSDSDRDGDLMQNSFETSNGFNPDNPADGLADSDSDGLSNSFEAYYGSSFASTDSDADTILDGNDSHPNDASNTGAVVPIPSGSYASGGAAFGNAFGSSQHYSRLSGTFVSNGQSKLLYVRGLDIDTADEVEVRLNGRSLGYMTGVANTSGLDNVFLIPAEMQWSGTNRIEFIDNTPGEPWGIDRMGLFALGNTFGYIVGTTGDRDHMNGIDLHLYKYKANVVEIAGWDSDTDKEITLTLNGMYDIGALPAGPDVSWTPLYQLLVANEYLSGINDYIRIKNQYPGAYNWGVKINAIRASDEGMGYFGGAVTTTVDELTYLVPVSGDYGQMPLKLWFYDSGTSELSVYVNGIFNTSVPSDAQSGIWGSVIDVMLNPGQIAKVRVDNALNPPSTNIWGVRIQEPSNMDGDEAPDYRDPWPNDNTRWADMDKDGIDDQVDPDIDGDGMSNTWETANGFDPYNPYDGDGDTDADGLSNYFEFIYGTNMYNTDSDGDTLMDGIDSAPALSNNTGAVVNAPMGSYTTTDYGWSYGTNQHYSVVTYVFNDPGVSKILMVKGYNSSNQSVLVRFNGEDIGYLTGIVSSLGKSNVWWLDKEKMRTGQNRIEFIRSGTGSWGISQLGVFNPGLTLGYIIGFTGGDRSHGEGVDIHVMGGKSSLIEMDLWDSDINGEIVMQSGGNEVGAMPAGVDNNWSQRYMYFWPSWYAAPGEDVVLSIMNFASPVYNWGIRLHGVHDAESGVGYLSEPAGPMADELTMLVPVAGDFGDMPFMLEFKETQGSELEIYVDGIYNGNSASTQNLWGGQKTIMLSADFQHAIRFNNTFNPPTPDPWGVRIVPPTDTDGDTVPDYMDAWPNDPAEQFDTDSDGTGNNADTDDDNDGIPDTTEQAMGLDPWNPSDASVDNDSDWLNNFFEYLYGTTPGNPDSDGDTVMDGMDSAPMNPSYNGLVVSIPKGSYDTTTYGWGLGTNLHNGVVMGKFQSDGYDKVFMAKGWDIDALDEVTVKLNGEIIGYLTNSSSDMGQTQANVWVFHNSRLRSGENRIEFVQKTGGETWGVSDLVLFNPGLTYGYIVGFTGGDRSHGEGIALHLPGNDSRFVELEGWDSDLNPEIEFQLAGWGETLYGLPIGPDNGWTPRYHLYMPKEYLTTGDNVLFIRNKLSAVYNWGIRFHGVTKALDGLGYQGPGPLTSTVDGAEILVPVMIDSGTMPLQLQFFDLQPGEVNVSVNGSYVGSPASDGGWGSPMDLNLPVNQMVKVSVDNTQNPPSTAYWGVRINDSADTDLDGVVDYLDPFPNDVSEWEDSDNDGIGDNADTDDDNDLMPDSYETGNGWDPYDPSNGMLDNDADGLRRSYEYVFGTSDFNTDSDADGANDSVDGDPATFNAVPPPVISLTTGVLNSGAFGWNYGTGVHEKRVIVKFNKDGYDKFLRVKGYDIDGYNNWPNYSSEVAVYLNGQLYGYMSPGLNNSVGKGEVFWLENEKLQPGENRVEFRQEIPVSEDWGITGLGVTNLGNTFGYIVGYTGGDRTHGDGVNVHFQGDGPRARYLELAAWDSDSLTEIALNLNGVPMFYLPTIGDATWSPWFQLYLPDEYMQAGDNVLFFNNPAGSTYNWGVKLNALRDHIVTDGKESLGWMTGQISNTTVNDMTMLIPVFGTQRYIDLGYYDIGSNEVSVMIDGAPNGYLPSTPALQWGSQSNYLLLSPNKMHELKADNVSNPPGTEQWVVQIGGYHP